MIFFSYAGLARDPAARRQISRNKSAFSHSSSSQRNVAPSKTQFRRFWFAERLKVLQLLALQSLQNHPRLQSSAGTTFLVRYCFCCCYCWQYPAGRAYVVRCCSNLPKMPGKFANTIYFVCEVIFLKIFLKVYLRKRLNYNLFAPLKKYMYQSINHSFI